MSLQLILGNSGSGKSYQLYKDIVTASVQSPGTQFLVIVPEQFTMQTQKELVHLHPNKGILNIDILSFQRLAHRIFEEVGADRRIVLEETGKTLLLRRAATKHSEELHILKGNLKKKGYLSQVKSLISEFTQYDIDELKMEKMLESAKERPQLYYKLQDIQTLYRAFQEELQGKYITAEETLEALCQVVERSELLRDSVIAIDGFTGFTPIQQKLLIKLLSLAKEVYITVTIDNKEDFYRIRGEHELFYLSKKTIRSVTNLAKEAGCEIREPVVLESKVLPRFCSSEELAFLEQGLFRTGREYKQDKWTAEPKDISLHTAANPMAEIHFAARTIRSLLKEGYRYHEIAIIVGDPVSYANYLPRVFQEYEIPCFMDSRRAIFANPFVEFLRAALDLFEQNFAPVSVFRYLRTGLCKILPEEIDLLENYVLAVGIKGYKAWKEPFVRVSDRFTAEQLAKCEELRKRIMEPLDPCRSVLHFAKTTAKEKTIALYQLGCYYDIQNQLAQYEEFFEKEERPDLQKEYSQVYQMVMGLYDKIVELLGAEKLNLKEYTQLLETGFEELKVGIIPPVSDQIQVGDLERTRLKDIKVLFFLGLNDGWVPKNGSGGGLLADTEREFLKDSHVELAPAAREDSYIQKFYFYMNVTKPSQKLYLSYCKSSSDGSVMCPSYVTRSFCRMFTGLKLQDEDRYDSFLGRAVTPKAGLAYLVEGLQKIREESPSGEWLELYQWYLEDESYHKQMEHLVEAAFLTFSDKGISRLAAKELYGEVLINSVSRLEKFASCAFAHFLQYGLQLQEREEYSFQSVDMGRITHKVVELFSRKVEQEEHGWENLTEEIRNRIVDECVDEVTAEYGQKILHSTARNEYMIQRIRRILRRTVWALQQQIIAGHFYPSGFEVSFSQARDLDAVNLLLSDQEKMKLQGRIDRIDTCEKEDAVYVKVIDYKSGSTSFDLVALYYGLQLQLVVYLNAAAELEKRIHPDKEIIPAGIFYYHVKDPVLEGTGEETKEELDEKILRELRPGGLINGDPAVYMEMDTQLSGASNVIPLSLKKDGTPDARSKTASKEQFQKLSAYVHSKMQELGSRMMQGEISAVPYERGNKTGCDFCIYRSICRIDKKVPGTHYRRLKELSPEEIWKQMEKQEDGNEVDEGTTDSN